MYLHTFQAPVAIAARVVSAKSSVVPRDGKQGERQDDHQQDRASLEPGRVVLLHHGLQSPKL